ncbi:hypothetical protein L1987_02982 [Smallanthus sonchifolius]|uniref:Uncharacterized protein n=1 Tax=Smallanthus sonchifolius TaxID=185202 RepID=A0ACB9K9A5_9ASTR|nr:hypothetical protein L1987_02982 [Smallanthus sonchifolius]
MHHTRYSNKSSPLLFDPEIEKTARQNKVFHRTDRVMSSPNHMENKPDHGKQSDLPPACQLPPEQQPTSGVFPSYVPPPRTDDNLNPSTNQFPYFPPFGQPLPQVSQPFEFKPNAHYSSPYVRIVTDPLPPPTSQPPIIRPSIFHSTPLPGFHPYTSGLDYEDDTKGYDDKFGGDEDKPHDLDRKERQRPRVPVYRRQDTGPVRGIESHFRPSIAYNPSPVAIPQQHGRSFEVRSQEIQNLPKYHGRGTEEPYLHLSAYDAMCNTIGEQGFTPDDVKLVLFQFTLEDKAQQWFHSLLSASIYTWGDMQQQFPDEF